MFNSDTNLVNDSSNEQPTKKGGMCLEDLPEGAVVEIETQHHNYTLVKHSGRNVRISGHPTICPEPVEMEIEGSLGSGSSSVPNPDFIAPGMYLVLRHPLFNRIVTSRIRDIHQLS
jgi:hypothetical protein